MRRKGLYGALLLGVLICLPVASCLGAGKFEPPEGKILFFAGQNTESIDDYVRTTGIVPAGLMLYTSVQNASSLSAPYDDGAGESYGHALLVRYPDAALQIGLYMVDALNDVTTGVYDDNIDAIGAWIKTSKRPVFLRIGYEFDGPHNHYDPAAYIRAYRYIVDRFRRNGVENVAYVWHSYASTVRRPLTDWYPGDDYVDWFGISFFRQHESEMLPMLALAKEHGKPVMVAEAAPMGISTTNGAYAWRQWFRRYFDFVQKNDIRCFCYINYDWDSYPMFADRNWKDNRISSSKELRDLWLAEIRNPAYVQSSRDLYSLIGFRSDGESSRP